MEKSIRIRDINFKDLEVVKKKCLWMNKDKEAICRYKNLYSIGDILQDSQYSNLFFEVTYFSHGGCICWLWNDLGVFAFRVGHVPSDYKIEQFLSMIENYPLAILKAKIEEDSANDNRPAVRGWELRV